MGAPRLLIDWKAGVGPAQPVVRELGAGNIEVRLSNAPTGGSCWAIVEVWTEADGTERHRVLTGGFRATEHECFSDALPQYRRILAERKG
jgi:hypothetical protein